MDLYYVDYLAVSGRSWLHRLPAGVKLISLLVIIAGVLALHTLPVYVAVLGGVLLFAVSARLPLRTYLALSSYPLVFLLIMFFSADQLTVRSVLTLAVRVLALTASVVLVLLTTSYPAIFAVLGRVLPSGLVAALFFTYRALFILSTCLINVKTALHLRGGMNWRHPMVSLKNLGNGLAHVLIHAIEMSQRVAESLVVRGFNNRIYSLGRKP
ncbi:MAG: energy-coupling factor transporter transmembrane component T family protein [Armatimonadota bacterium]